MNDVKGNYTRNETRSAADNADSNNQYFASTVAMRNTESRTAAIGVYFVSTCNALLIDLKGAAITTAWPLEATG